MQTPRSTPRSGVWGRWLTLALATLLVCTLLGALFAAQLSLFYTIVQKRELSWWETARYSMPSWYIWGLLVPAVAWVVARCRPALRWDAIGVHAAAGAALSVVHVLLTSTWMWTMELGSPQASPWTEVVVFQFLAGLYIDLLTYACLVGGIAAWMYQRESRDRALRAAQLESQLAEARLSALRAQLRPHFLFNTLNAIAALLRENPEAAERMLLAFSDLLRSAIDERRDRVSLREELAFVRRYLEIEQMRFGNRLQVRWDTASDTLDETVPHLLLQPLVENSVRHGLGARSGPCAIEVSSRRDNGRVILTVRDTGPGAPQGVVTEGLGLRATRARLSEMFGDQFELAVTNDPLGGCRAEIRIPSDATLPPEPGDEG